MYMNQNSEAIQNSEVTQNKDVQISQTIIREDQTQNSETKQQNIESGKKLQQCHEVLDNQNTQQQQVENEQPAFPQIQQKQEGSTSNIQIQSKQAKDGPSRQTHKSQGKKDKQPNKKVQITKKQLKQYLKFATDCQNLKKQNQKIKKQYNKVAKQLISTKQQLDKKSNLVRSSLSEHKSSLQKIERMQAQYMQIAKKMKQEQKHSQKQAGLEETIKQLQKIIDMSTKNENMYQREAQKYKQILRIQKQMNSNVKTQVQQLRHISGQYFLLKQQVSRLFNQLRSLKDVKEQYPKMVQKYNHQQQINQKLKQTIKQLQSKSQKDKSFIQRLQKKVDRSSDDKRCLDVKIMAIMGQKEQRQGQIQAFKMQLQDQRAQLQVQRKRYTAEIKDLKLALHHQHQKLKLTQVQLQQSKKKQKKTVKLQGVKFSTLSKEDLFNLIEQLEMKNASIKINLNTLLEDLSQKDKRINQLQTNLMSLTRHIVKALPNLDESQGMEYVEKEVIELGMATKEDWAQIVQKITIQNLRLKNSVTALGEQYNMRLRSETDNFGK